MEKIERFGAFLDQHPFVGIPVRLFFTFLLPFVFFGWGIHKLLPKFLLVLGWIVVTLSLIYFVLWILGRGVTFGEVLTTYLFGQGLKLAAWLYSTPAPKKS